MKKNVEGINDGDGSTGAEMVWWVQLSVCC